MDEDEVIGGVDRIACAFCGGENQISVSQLPNGHFITLCPTCSHTVAQAKADEHDQTEWTKRQLQSQLASAWVFVWVGAVLLGVGGWWAAGPRALLFPGLALVLAGLVWRAAS